MIINILQHLFLFLLSFFLSLTIIGWISYGISHIHKNILLLIPAIFMSILSTIMLFMYDFSNLPILFGIFITTVFSWVFVFLDMEEIYKTSIYSSLALIVPILFFIHSYTTGFPLY